MLDHEAAQERHELVFYRVQMQGYQNGAAALQIIKDAVGIDRAGTPELDSAIGDMDGDDDEEMVNGASSVETAVVDADGSGDGDGGDAEDGDDSLFVRT